MNNLSFIKYQLNVKKTNYVKAYILGLLSEGIEIYNFKKGLFEGIDNKNIYYISRNLIKEKTAIDTLMQYCFSDVEQNNIAIEYYSITDIPPIEACIVQELIVKNNKASVKTYIDRIDKYNINDALTPEVVRSKANKTQDKYTAIEDLFKILNKERLN